MASFWWWLGFVWSRAYKNMTGQQREDSDKTFREHNPDYGEEQEKEFLAGVKSAHKEQ